MDQREHNENTAKIHLEVPDPVALQLQRSGRLGDVRVVTDRPPPVRRPGTKGYHRGHGQER